MCSTSDVITDKMRIHSLSKLGGQKQAIKNVLEHLACRADYEVNPVTTHGLHATTHITMQQPMAGSNAAMDRLATAYLLDSNGIFTAHAACL